MKAIFCGSVGGRMSVIFPSVLKRSSTSTGMDISWPRMKAVSRVRVVGEVRISCHSVPVSRNFFANINTSDAPSGVSAPLPKW